MLFNINFLFHTRRAENARPSFFFGTDSRIGHPDHRFGSVSFIFLIFATKKHRPRGYHNVRKNSAFNASSGVRTLDTLIKSQVLCQLS